MDVTARLERLSSAATALRLAVLDSPATIPVDVRRAAFAGSLEAPAALTEYVALVEEQPYRVTEARLLELRSTSMSEDGIFEVTVAAALGAAQRRLDGAVELLETTGDS